MSIKSEIVWDGLEAFRDHLTRVIPRAIMEAAEAALDRAGDDAVNWMQMIVPVRTGDLQSTCRKISEREPTQAGFYHVVVAAGGMRGKRAGNLVDYAGDVEHGTVHQRPQPYMQPSLRRASRNIEGYFYEELEKRVETE